MSASVGSSTSDLCMAGVSGAVHTQILGVSTGEMVRDENCEQTGRQRGRWQRPRRPSSVCRRRRRPSVRPSTIRKNRYSSLSF